MIRPSGILFFSILLRNVSTAPENVEVLLCYLPDTVNGEIIIHDKTYSEYPNAVLPGTRIELRCNKGFGSAITTAVCLDNGYWSDNVGKCYRRQTLTLTDQTGCHGPFLGNGLLIPQTRGIQLRSTHAYIPGTKVVVACRPGFLIKNGGPVGVCLTSGNWSDPLGSCEPGEPVDLSHIQRRVEKAEPTLATTTSKSTPTTTTKRNSVCDENPTIAYGVVAGGAAFVNAQRKFSCLAGFSLMGIGMAQCSDIGRWIFNGICVKDCAATPVVPNGYVVTGTFSVGSTRKVECLNGYTLVGPALITCKDDGQWTKPGLCGKAQLFLVSGAFTFNEGIEACEKLGARIALVKSCTDDTAIKSLMLTGSVPVKNAWIGLRRASKNPSRWRWVTNGEFLESNSYQGWWPGYPDNKDNDDDCVIYQTWNDFAAGWNDIQCDTRTWISSDVRMPYVSQNIGVVCEKSFFQLN